MTLQYRLAQQDDIPGINEVNLAAYNALNRRYGFQEAPAGPPHSFFVFSVVEEPDGCWVAEDAGRIVGFSISWVRSSFWFLAYLFISPDNQEQGVGRRLIERALAHGGEEAENRVLITFAYNPVSIALYVRYGMYPREPLYVLEGPAEVVRQRPNVSKNADPERLAPNDESAALLGRIDEQVLGVPRAKHHRYLLNAPGSICYLFRARGELQGYAYVWATGRLGPLAVASPESLEPVMRTGLMLAGTPPTERVSVLLAGSNAPAMSLALENTMRITQPLLLMSLKSFGKLGSYLFHSPMVM